MKFCESLSLSTCGPLSARCTRSFTGLYNFYVMFDWFVKLVFINWLENSFSSFNQYDFLNYTNDGPFGF